ncbi:MAG TPA: STAS domain-containing protein [Micromonosporaceae bacterium]
MAGSPALTVDVVLRSGSSARVRLVGEIDFCTVDELRRILQQLLDSGHTRLTLDVAEVTFCDSSGLGVLVSTRAGAERRGGRLTLDGTQGQLARLMRTTGLEILFGPAPAGSGDLASAGDVADAG